MKNRIRITITAFVLFAVANILLAGCVDSNDKSSDVNVSPHPQREELNQTLTDSDNKKNDATIKQFINNSGFSGSLYVLSSEKGNLLIDPGYYDKEVEDYLTSIGGLDEILITHGHWDHINGLDAVKEDYPQAETYIHELDEEFLIDPVLNQSSVNGFSLVVKTNVNLLSEKTYKIGNFNVEVIHTPGHTIGSSMFYLEEENVLFTGDTIMYDTVGTTYRPTGSDPDLSNSLEKFKQLEFKDDMKVFFGHGNNTEYLELMRVNEYLK